MPFFDHIAELRKRMVYIVLFVFLGSLVLYANIFYQPILQFVMHPIQPVLHDLGIKQLITLGPFEPFMVRFKVAIVATLIIGSPFITYQIMAFFLPALRPKERKWVVPIFIALVFFFLLGAAFCYSFILGPGFKWLATQGGPSIAMQPLADKWLTGIMLFMLAFGIGFETPVVVFGLVYTELVPYKTMRKNWRYAYLIISLVAAFATPDWSWLSMGSLAACMVVLYEGSMAFSWVLLRKKIKAQQLAEVEA